jgi:two-component system sensor kinase FixL
VNQPLYSIMNYAKACRNVLLQSDPRNDKLLQWNEQIAAEAARAGEIIKRMRDLARKAKARRLPTGVHDVVGESLALVAFETRRLHVKVRKEFCESVRLANFDRIQIQQVLVNLLRNACDALETRPQGERQITIRTTTDGAFVEVVISDNGPGLQEVEAARVFDAFVTSKAAGLGMGLAISKSIIETHGGRIWVTGNLGGGAEFHFTLPFTTGERTND